MKPLAAALLLVLAVSARAEPLWVAVGYHDMRMYSHDGIHWTRANELIEASEARYSDYALKVGLFANGRFVAMQTNESREKTSGASVRVYAPQSRDGLVWEKAYAEIDPADFVLFARGQFVAIQGRQLLISRDAIHFSGRFGDDGNMCMDFACGDTEAGFRYVALGWGENCTWRAVTSDAVRWDASDLISEDASVAHGAGHFVMVTRSGAVERSHDGQTWLVQRERIPDEGLEQIVWTGDRFLAIGLRTWSSPDGITWTLFADPGFTRVVWADGRIGVFCRRQDWSIVFSRDFRNWQPTDLPRDAAAIAYRDQ